MNLKRRLAPVVSCLVAFVACASLAAAQQFDQRLYQGMRWRMIGPFRAGRTVGASGVPGRPNVFYVGVNNGGVWKTDDYGRTWQSLFDEQPTGSIGAIPKPMRPSPCSNVGKPFVNCFQVLPPSVDL